LRLLLDEHISPTLVRRLAQIGVYALSVPHVGLSGYSDTVIWRYALRHDFAVVTTNAQDFIELLDVELHPGLIVFRESGLSREEQWMRLEPVIRHVLRARDQDYLVNKLVEVTAPGKFSVREIFQR
jgi:predicted nuclease of predicted toxin-antitoxin system